MNIDDNIAALDNFCNMLGRLKTDWDCAVAEEKRCNEEITDLLHEVELTPFDIQKGFRISRELCEARKRRRVAKDYLYAMEGLRKFLDFKNIPISLFKVLKDQKAIRENYHNRLYRPRVRHDLKIEQLYKESLNNKKEEGKENE
jgi:hypothetical protein